MWKKKEKMWVGARHQAELHVSGLCNHLRAREHSLFDWISIVFCMRHGTHSFHMFASFLSFSCSLTLYKIPFSTAVHAQHSFFTRSIRTRIINNFFCVSFGLTNHSEHRMSMMCAFFFQMTCIYPHFFSSAISVKERKNEQFSRIKRPYRL